ncbi:MAG TPA: hypothetical protein VJS69_13805 [Candidatus Krumholzibacteria bacterium]|nr:hypothetical protein [Candidatus Krumholzibacteria bacterium]
MKSSLLVLVAVMVFACPALAQNPNYHLELYADATQSSCGLDAAQAGVVSVHAFLKGDAPTTGFLFALYLPSCFAGATWLDDHTAQPWATIGSTQIPMGLSVGTGACVSLPLYVGHFDFMAPGGTASCCAFDVSHPTGWTYFSSPALATDCDFKEWEVSARGLTVNPSGTCACGSGTFLATEPSTWGHVKSLYR